MTEFRPLLSQHDLDVVWRASRRDPVIVFKHSETCGTSWMARELLSEGHVPAPVHEVVVQHQRLVSDAVATRLGVRHESPQILVVVAGVAVWHSSHAGVTLERVARAWEAAVASLIAVPAAR